MPNGTSVFPSPVNQAFHDQLPSSSNGLLIGVPTDDHRRSNHFINGSIFSYKRKNAEWIPGNSWFCNASVGSSSAIAPLNTHHVDPGFTPMEVASFPLLEYQGNDTQSVMESGSHRSLRNGSCVIGADSMLTHNSSHMIQAGYPGQAFQRATSSWFNNNGGGGGGTLTWSQAPSVTYLHGSTIGANQEIAGNISSTTLLHLPPIHQVHPSLLPHPPQPLQEMRGLHPQAAMPSHRLSTNNTPSIRMHPFQDGMEMGPRHMEPVPPTGFRIYQPHQRAFMPGTTSRQLDLPHLRVLPADEVAMLEISGYYEVGNSIDDHRDMRLDIDHMSYEELLALGERIGNVGTGLSEETITSHLKTRTYTSSTCINLEEAACLDQEIDFCVICQTDYKNRENIGILDCGHEYHVDCVKRWLLIKNTCPVCKSSALTMERRNL
ncbi:hypothetical protein NMG60_11003381 [Bertholletia excelsa]